MSMSHFYAVIMAGGGGTRLWPMSRTHQPKQMLPLVEDQSMFRVSVERLAPLFPPERIYVVTGERYIDGMHADCPEIPRANFIGEPNGKNTGPAAALAAAVIYQRDPDATIALLTADHHIGMKDRFRAVLAAAYELAQAGRIVTLGISPSIPSTGFGYIQRGEALREIDGFACYHARNFTEKPDATTAAYFIQSGDYSWNSGMFIWRADEALHQFELHQPDIHRAMVTLQPTVDTPAFQATLTQVWEDVPKVQIDTGVMEAADNIAVIPVDIGWSDVGSWDALFDVLNLDESGNGYKGASPNRVVIDTHNSLVYSNKMIVTIGVDDLVIVDTDDVLMVCHKARTQDVRRVVELLRDMQGDSYL